MDNIYFKRQQGRISLALQVKTSEVNKRENMTSLYNEAINSGMDIVLVDSETDQSDDMFIQSMTFGLGNNSTKTNIQSDTLFPNAIPASTLLLCIVIENMTEYAAQLSMGTTAGGTDVFSCVSIAAKANDINGLTTININKPFDMDNACSAFLHHGGLNDVWNGAKLNISFILRSV